MRFCRTVWNLAISREQLRILRIEKIAENVEFVVRHARPSVRLPGMNSISAAAQAAAMRSQPSTVSWSVSAMARRP